MLISGQRAAALSLGNRRDSADSAAPVLIERSAWLDAAPAPATWPIPAAISTVRRSARLTRFRWRTNAVHRAALALGAQGRTAAGIVGGRGASRRGRGRGVRGDRRRVGDDDRGARRFAARRSAQDPDHRLSRGRRRTGACRAAGRRIRRQAAARAVAQRMPDRRRVRQPQMRLRAAIARGAQDHRRGGGGVLCSTCVRRAAASASPTSCAPMRCRIAGSTRSRPTSRLGFADDERDYAHAAAMLRSIGDRRGSAADQQSGQGRGLEAQGIRVAERIAHHMPVNPHNADYLAVKRDRSGHLP